MTIHHNRIRIADGVSFVPARALAPRVRSQRRRTFPVSVTSIDLPEPRPHPETVARRDVAAEDEDALAALAGVPVDRAEALRRVGRADSALTPEVIEHHLATGAPLGELLLSSQPWSALQVAEFVRAQGWVPADKVYRAARSAGFDPTTASYLAGWEH